MLRACRGMDGLDGDIFDSFSESQEGSGHSTKLAAAEESSGLFQLLTDAANALRPPQGDNFSQLTLTGSVPCVSCLQNRLFSGSVSRADQLNMQAFGEELLRASYQQGTKNRFFRAHTFTEKILNLFADSMCAL